MKDPTEVNVDNQEMDFFLLTDEDIIDVLNIIVIRDELHSQAPLRLIVESAELDAIKNILQD